MKTNRLAIIGLMLLGILASVSVWRILDKGISQNAIDFHAYWYSGHYILQGSDPYVSWYRGLELTQSVRYLDGVDLPASQVKQNNWRVTPANTAPVMLLLSMFSLFSWSVATALWAVTNFCFVVLMAWMLARDGKRSAFSMRFFALFLTILSLVFTREVFEYGQTTFLILVCMLAAFVLSPRHALLSGVLLGIALSKYSLAFPAFFLFLYRRRWFTLLTSIVTQVASVLFVNWISNTSPLDTISAYIQIGIFHSGQPGIQLASGWLKGLGWWTNGIILTSSLVIGIVLIYWHRNVKRRLPEPNNPTAGDWLLLTTLMAWNLLVVYHKLYDGAAVILFIGFMVRIGSNPFALAKSQRRLVCVTLIPLIAIWSLPIYSVIGVDAFVRLLELANLAVLFLSIWLLFHLENGNWHRPNPVTENV